MGPGSALGGLRVVDLSNQRTGAQASQVLADFGADVVHVEPPGGSPLREEAAWPFWARGKRAVELDLHDPEDLSVAKRLARSADVMIETFRPGVADRLGMGYEALSAENPRLVYGSITGFGRSGPYAHLQGYEGVVMSKVGVPWALAGMAAWRNAGSTIPEAADLTLQEIKAASLQLGTAVLGVGNADGLSAVTVASALMLSLYARRRGKGGQEALTTMVSSTANALSEMIVEYEGRPDPAMADRDLHGFSALYRLHGTAEEWVFLAASSERAWKRLVGALAAGADVACFVVARDPVEANYLDEGSIGRECGLMTRSQHKILDEMPQVAPLVSFSRSATVAGGAGILGEHTEKVLLEYGYSPQEIASMDERGIIIRG